MVEIVDAGGVGVVVVVGVVVEAMFDVARMIEKSNPLTGRPYAPHSSDLQTEHTSQRDRGLLRGKGLRSRCAAAVHVGARRADLTPADAANLVSPAPIELGVGTPIAVVVADAIAAAIGVDYVFANYPGVAVANAVDVARGFSDAFEKYDRPVLYLDLVLI